MSRRRLAPAVLALLVGAASACAPAATVAGTELAARPLAAPAARPPRAVQPWGALRGDVIPLWVDSVPGVPGWTPELVALVHEAAAAWRTPGVPVRFVRAADPSEALVRVHWRAQVAWRVEGVTRREVNADGETIAADCWIVLTSSRDGGTLPAASLRTTVLHELGHALGLPHAEGLRAVMYDGVRFGAAPREVTSADRAALRGAYAGRLVTTVAAGAP